MVACDRATLDLADRDSVRARPSPAPRPTSSSTPGRGPRSTPARPTPTGPCAINALGVRWVADAARRVGRPRRARLHRLRVRRHQGRRRTSSGTPPTRVGLRPVEARRRARGRPGRHDRAHGVGVRRPRPQHGQDGAAACADQPELAFVDDQRGCPTFTADLAAAIRRLAVGPAPGHLPRHQPGRHHLVRVRPRRSSRRPGTTPTRCARSPPPSSIRPARRPVRPTRCSTTPPCALAGLPLLPHYRDALDRTRERARRRSAA